MTTIEVTDLISFLADARPELKPATRKRLDALLAGDPTAALRVAVGDARLTPVEFDTLEYIDRYSRLEGMSPTMQEIADARGVSKVTVFAAVSALARKGVLTRDRNKTRSLRVVKA